MPVDIIDGLSKEKAQEMAEKMDFSGPQLPLAVDVIKGPLSLV